MVEALFFLIVAVIAILDKPQHVKNCACTECWIKRERSR